MSQTGIMDVQAGNAYAQSFGAMADKTKYVDVFNKSLDIRPKLQEFASMGLKALNTATGGSGSTDKVMVPIYLDPQIVDLTRKETPLVELVPRVTNMGITADFNTITAKGGAFTQSEDASLSETNTTFARTSKPIKYLYSVGRVTGQSLAAYPSYVMAGMMPTGGDVGGFNDVGAPNSKQLEILIKTREIRELEENLIVAGNATTNGISGNIGPAGSEFDGIVQTLGSTNTVAKGTTALSLNDINKSVRYAYDDGGRPNLAICSSGVFEDLLGLLTAKIGYMQSMKQVFWGFSTIVLYTAVGEIPVVQSRYLSNTSGSKAIYFLDMSVVEMRVLQDLTYEELAKTNDSQKFMLKQYEVLIIRAPTFCSSITGISA